jgi:hypothetical protein
VAWKDDNAGRTGPGMPGGAGARWHDYGASSGGRLKLTVGDAFHFILAEAADFEEPDLNSSISEADGTTILCLNDACTEEDRRRMGHFRGGSPGKTSSPGRAPRLVDRRGSDNCRPVRVLPCRGRPVHQRVPSMIQITTA